MRILCLSIILASAVLAPSFAETITMQAGVAKAVITNAEPLVMVNGNTSSGTLYDLYTRVLVLNDGNGRMIFVGK